MLMYIDMNKGIHANIADQLIDVSIRYVNYFFFFAENTICDLRRKEFISLQG
jgi:hypothetical protein